MCEVEAVSKIAKCLQVPLGKVQLNEEQVYEISIIKFLLVFP